MGCTGRVAARVSARGERSGGGATADHGDGAERPGRSQPGERKCTGGGQATAQIPLARVPDGVAEQLVGGSGHESDVTRKRYSLCSRHAIRDCNENSSMNPGEAVWEKRPPDSVKEARLASYTAFSEERVMTRAWPL